MEKSFRTQDLASIQARQWQTDYERGELLPKDRLEARTFDAVADEWWIRHEAQSLIEGARRNDKYRLEALKRMYGRRQLRELVFKDGDAWVTMRMIAKAAVGTIKRELRILHSIMNYAVSCGYLPTNPFRGLKCPGKENIHDRWMTQTELDALIRAARELHDHDLVDVIAVGVNTGFRKGNLERLTAQDIRNNRIYARVTKSGEPYDVPIAPAIVPTLKRLVEANPTGKLLRTEKLGQRFRKAAKKAGLYTDKKDLQRVTVHTLRHTFAVLYLNRGGALYDLSKLLGHASPAMTDKVYARFTRERKDAQAPLMSTPILDQSVVEVIC
jgi:integrase